MNIKDEEIKEDLLLRMFENKMNFLKFVKNILTNFEINFNELIFFKSCKESGNKIYADYKDFSIMLDMNYKKVIIDNEKSRHCFRSGIRRTHFLKKKILKLQHGYQNKKSGKYFMYMSITLK